MLVYLNAGRRRYGDRPVGIYHRQRWEFQAVVAGGCAPALDHARAAFPHHQRLWVFGPDHRHGWTAPAGSTCRIAVAHFDRVPETLRAWVGGAGMQATNLTPAEGDRLEALLTNLRPDYHRPTRLSDMRCEHALLELSMLAMKHQIDHPLSSQQDHARQKVSQALAWYGEHLLDRPGVEQVAAAVFVSPSHLRRLFARVGHGSPLAAMHRVQIERAKQLMQHPMLALTDVAMACGYSSLSVLSRSFRAETGRSPRAWRRSAAAGAAGEPKSRARLASVE